MVSKLLTFLLDSIRSTVGAHVNSALNILIFRSAVAARLFQERVQCGAGQTCRVVSWIRHMGARSPSEDIEIALQE